MIPYLSSGVLKRSHPVFGPSAVQEQRCLFLVHQGKSLQSGTRRIGRSCIPTCTHIFVLEVCQQVPVYLNLPTKDSVA